MKAKFIVFLMLLSSFAYTQKEFRPILDSSSNCSYYNPNYEYSESPRVSKQILEIYYIAEEMPTPKTKIEEIEHIIETSLTLSEQDRSLKSQAVYQCVINCKGVAGDFQIISCSPSLLNTGCQILDVFRENFNRWNPGKQRGHNIDMLIKIYVNMHSGKFDIILSP